MTDTDLKALSEAAKALHEAVLPKISYEIRESGFGGAFAYLWNPRKQPRPNDGYRTEADTPARAWLCAILKALISQEETET